jgi:hypothetical protein
MQRWILTVGGLLLAASCASAQNSKGQSAAKYGWHNSWEAARAEAQRSGKPLFVVFRCEP